MKTFLILLGSVVCALAGWLMGRATRTGTPVPVARPPLSAVEKPAPTPAPPPPLLSEAMERIAAQVQGKKSTTEITMRVYEALKDLRSEDFPAAIAAANQSTGVGPLGGSLLAGYWAERDLAAAKKWLFGLPEAQREKFLWPIAETWGRLEPASLFAWLEALPDAELHRVGATIMPLFAHGAPGLDPARVAELFLALPSQDEKATEFHSIFAWWARTVPAAAAEKALTLPAGAARSAAVEATVASWAGRDPQAALAWVRQLSDAALAARAMPAYATGFAQKDPCGAVEFVAELPATESNQNALQAVVKTWTGSDGAAALAWAERLDDAELRGRIFDTMIETLTDTDVDAAARIYAQHTADLPGENSFSRIHFAESYFDKCGMDATLRLAADLPEWNRELLISSALNTWARRNPDELAAWALQSPEGFARATALESMVNGKYNVAPQHLIDWLHALPPTPSSDPALVLGAQHIFQQDPAAGVELLGHVSEREHAHYHLLTFTRWFLRDDAPKARAWIEATPALTAKDKAELLRKP